MTAGELITLLLEVPADTPVLILDDVTPNLRDPIAEIEARRSVLEWRWKGYDRKQRQTVVTLRPYRQGQPDLGDPVYLPPREARLKLHKKEKRK